MKLNEAGGLNEKTTGTLRTLCGRQLQGIVGHSHRTPGRKVTVWGAHSYSWPTPTVPMGAIGGDKPAWMAAIERNHLGPVLTHNPPGPPWVMDVGWWAGGVGQGGDVNVSGPASGFIMSFLTFSIPSLLLIILSIISETALTSPWHRQFSHFVSRYLPSNSFDYDMRVLAQFCAYAMYKSSPHNLCWVCYPQNIVSWHIYTAGFQNQGHHHLWEFNSFQAPCSLISRSRVPYSTSVNGTFKRIAELCEREEEGLISLIQTAK